MEKNAHFAPDACGNGRQQLSQVRAATFFLSTVCKLSKSFRQFLPHGLQHMITSSEKCLVFHMKKKESMELHKAMHEGVIR
ncbi:hypothetical protein SESBI_11654 [Sesbania bispinosa]|nr:hypothetical protein SESBI_11654 [Sesbania bispinosa]